MAKIEYSFPCPACGKPIKGQRGAKEFKKHFECKKCTRRFSVTFAYPSQQELEDAFLAGELRPNIILRTPRKPQDNFPFEIFNFKKR